MVVPDNVPERSRVESLLLSRRQEAGVPQEVIHDLALLDTRARKRNVSLTTRVNTKQEKRKMPAC